MLFSDPFICFLNDSKTELIVTQVPMGLWLRDLSGLLIQTGLPALYTGSHRPRHADCKLSFREARQIKLLVYDILRTHKSEELEGQVFDSLTDLYRLQGDRVAHHGGGSVRALGCSIRMDRAVVYVSIYVSPKAGGTRMGVYNHRHRSKVFLACTICLVLSPAGGGTEGPLNGKRGHLVKCTGHTQREAIVAYSI